MLNGFISLTVVYVLCSNYSYVVKKGHEQVEKTLEMKKWSRNGKVIKQGVGMCMMFSQCNTCSMVIYQAYDTISRGVWPHRGPCLLRFFFSRLPEALRGLMTKQTSFRHT